MRHNIVTDGNGGSVTVFVNGQLLVADSNHPNYRAIVEAVLDGDESVVALFDPSRTVAERFERLSERVAVSGGHVFFDGDEVNDALTEQILRFMEQGVEDWQPLVNFYEKVAQNPSEHSRENLYRWLNATGGFTITPDGDIVGYKGLRADRTSVHAGPAVVNGEAVNGHVPNEEGSVVEMARSKVNHDPSVGCSTGLHVGTWDYASRFGYGVTVKVHVNPRDVVSVPTDCSDAKMRVSRYVVAEPAQGVDNRALAMAEDFDDDDYDEGLCPDCDDVLNDEGWCSTCREYTY